MPDALKPQERLNRKMQYKLEISLGTNIFDGYSLFDALIYTSENGLKSVEIASIDGVCEHIKPEDMSDELLAEVKSKLKKLKLKIVAFSGHVDLTVEEGLRRFFKKMEFAKGLGAKIINTNAGPLSRLQQFKDNIKAVIEKAEELNIKVGLESHGDIISSAHDSLGIIKEINHPLIRLNYDTGNVYYHSKKIIDPSEDIIDALDFIEYIHLKDIRVESRKIEYCALGDGSIKLNDIFNILKQYDRIIPMTIEIPIYLFCYGWGPLKKGKTPLEIEKIKEAIQKSVDYIKKFGIEIV